MLGLDDAGDLMAHDEEAADAQLHVPSHRSVLSDGVVLGMSRCTV